MQIGKTIAAHHELARRTACLQRTDDVEEAAFVAVDLMREATLQSLARVIEALLRVAHPVEQLAPDCTCAVIHVPAKIGNVRYNEFSCSARCGRAQVGYEIAD